MERQEHLRTVRATFTTLESLLNGMRERHPLLAAEWVWTSLPTFGGDEPNNTAGIWSWDADRVIVGTCADDVEIQPRSDEAGW